MKSVFLLQHSYERTDGYEETKIIGIFSTKEKVKECIKKFEGLDGFKDYPDCFFVDEYEIDKENWTEGFVTMK
jgi:hypothetical protein